MAYPLHKLPANPVGNFQDYSYPSRVLYEPSCYCYVFQDPYALCAWLSDLYGDAYPPYVFEAESIADWIIINCRGSSPVLVLSVQDIQKSQFSTHSYPHSCQYHLILARQLFNGPMTS